MYLLTNLPLANPVLRDMSCVYPANQKSEDARPARQLCLLLTKVIKTNAFCDCVMSDWLICIRDTDGVLEE
jgi:hypothetical protein